MSCSIGQKLVKERMPAEEENIPYNQQYLKLNYSFWFKKKKKDGIRAKETHDYAFRIL